MTELKSPCWKRDISYTTS